MSIRLMSEFEHAAQQALASSGSSGGPQMPSPVMRIAPNPRRPTSRSPPIVKVSMPGFYPPAAFGRETSGTTRTEPPRSASARFRNSSTLRSLISS